MRYRVAHRRSAARSALTQVLGLMSKTLRHYPLLLSAAFTFGTPAICVGLTLAFGDLCWPQRVGAVYVGLAVLLQGLISADPDRFARKFTNGTTLRQHINQQSYFAAVFGTLFAAFGDLLPIYYGLPLCSG